MLRPFLAVTCPRELVDGIDPSIQAAWIGVGGALVGAFVGAFVGGQQTSRAATKATDRQWELEREARALDRLHGTVESLQVAVTTCLHALDTAAPRMHPVAEIMKVNSSATRAAALAEVLSPQLSKMLSLFANRLQAAANNGRSIKEIAVPAAAIWQITLHWVPDPVSFEAAPPEVVDLEQWAALNVMEVGNPSP